MSVKQIEAWINTSLEKIAKEKLLGISDKIRDRRPDVAALNAMNIDRLTLNSHGVSNENIDRIYMALRSNTLGMD